MAQPHHTLSPCLTAMLDAFRTHSAGSEPGEADLLSLAWFIALKGAAPGIEKAFKDELAIPVRNFLACGLRIERPKRFREHDAAELAVDVGDATRQQPQSARECSKCGVRVVKSVWHAPAPPSLHPDLPSPDPLMQAPGTAQ